MSTSKLQYPHDALRDSLMSKGGSASEEDTRILHEIVDTLFFASLGREEGQTPRLHVIYHNDGVKGIQQSREDDPYYDSYVGPQPTWDVIPFEPKPFTPQALVKLTPAINLERTAVIVGPQNGQLHILGLARRIKNRDGGGAYIVSAPEPGSIVISRAGQEFFRYEKGRHIQTQPFDLWDALSNDGLIQSALASLCGSLMATLPDDFPIGFPFQRVVRVMRGLIESMVAARHGGIIAILPDMNYSEDNIVYQIPKSHRTLLSEQLQMVVTADLEVSNLQWQAAPVGHSRTITSEQEDDIGFAQIEQENARHSLDSLIESIGHLTAVDNALLFGPDLAFIGAGYPIPTPPDTIEVHEAKCLKGEWERDFNLDQHGSRHRAAACFAHRHPGGLIFIVSQDGPLRCMLRPTAHQDASVMLWNIRLPVI